MIPFPLLFALACRPAEGDTSKDGSDSKPVDSAREDSTPSDSIPDDSTGEGSPPPLALPASPRRQVDPLVCVAFPATDGAPFVWTVDGVAFDGLLLTTTVAGDTVFPGYTRPGQVWTCTGTTSEGVTASASTEIVDVDPLELDPLVAVPVSAVGGIIRYNGILDATSGVSARYGFDGWSARAAPASASVTLTDEGDALYSQDIALTWDGSAWTGAIDVPAAAHAVQMIFSAGTSVDDADGLEYAWDFAFPSVGPYLTWDDLARPETGVVVHWATGQPGLGLVEVGPDEDHVAWVAGSEPGTLHHVRIAGLPPDTRFVYRVRDASGRTSPWSHFTTAPVDADTFTFLVMSDMQDGGAVDERWHEIAAWMATDWPDARFVLSPGDLTANDHPGLWWMFFDSARGLFDHVPIIPAVGNHDTPGKESSPDTSSFERWFGRSGADGDTAWRRDDYGRLRILSLDSETPDELREGGAQYEWLRAEADAIGDEAARTVDWAIVQLHHPPYDAGARFAGETSEYRPLTSPLDGRVDLVLAGHEHIYQRFLPLQFDGVLAPSGQYGLGPDDGVCYVVTASAADLPTTALVDVAAPGGEQRQDLAWPAVADDVNATPMDHGYLVVDVTPETLDVTSLGLGTSEAPVPPTVRDEVVLGH